MLETLIKALPNGINLFFFFGGIIGLFISFYFRKDSFDCHASSIAIVVLFLIVWRVFFKIISARYALFLILPFSFFIVLGIHNINNKKVKTILYLVLFGGMLIQLGIKMAKSINSGQAYYTIAEYMQEKNKSIENYRYNSPTDDYPRIKYLSRIKPLFIYPMTSSELQKYIYYRFYEPTVFCVVSTSDEHCSYNNEGEDRIKHIISIKANSKSNKRYHIYLVKTIYCK